MKKLIIFTLLAALACNFNLFSINKKHDQEKLSKTDKFKLAAGVIGWSWFTVGSLMTYQTKVQFMEDLAAEIKVQHIPTMIVGGPVAILLKFLKGNDFNDNVWAGITGFTNLGLAAGCVAYIYKKLASLKKSNAKVSVQDKLN